MIARILGLPEADSAQFQRWSIDLLNIFNDWDRGLSALGSLRTYLEGHIADRRREPRDDLTSELVLSEVDGKSLDDDAIFAFLRLLLPAGIETTYRSLGNLLLGLLTHTDQLQAVVEQPELQVGAIEEGLRWEAPFLMVIRKSTADTEVADVEIPRGCEISVFVASANHDERHFSDPESFNIHRSPVPHVTFGSGPHVCLGMHLSRLESRVAAQCAPRATSADSSRPARSKASRRRIHLSFSSGASGTHQFVGVVANGLSPALLSERSGMPDIAIHPEVLAGQRRVVRVVQVTPEKREVTGSTPVPTTGKNQDRTHKYWPSISPSNFPQRAHSEWNRFQFRRFGKPLPGFASSDSELGRISKHLFVGQRDARRTRRGNAHLGTIWGRRCGWVRSPREHGGAGRPLV